MLMINLEDSSSQLGNLSSRSAKQGSAGQLNNVSQLGGFTRSSSGQSIERPNKSTKSNSSQPNQKSTTNESALNSSGQSTNELNGTLKQFCDQINLLQKEFAAVDEEQKRSFMLKIEEFVLKNMRKLVVDKVDSFFDTLQLYLAQLKFEIIQFAVESEQKRQQSANPNSGRPKKSKNSPLDHNNNNSNSFGPSKQQNSGLRNNLRNNLQSRTVERRMVELRRSIETYLKSYLVRILLEMQDQAN